MKVTYFVEVFQRQPPVKELNHLNLHFAHYTVTESDLARRPILVNTGVNLNS